MNSYHDEVGATFFADFLQLLANNQTCQSPAWHSVLAAVAYESSGALYPAGADLPIAVSIHLLTSHLHVAPAGRARACLNQVLKAGADDDLFCYEQRAELGALVGAHLDAAYRHHLPRATGALLALLSVAPSAEPADEGGGAGQEEVMPDAPHQEPLQDVAAMRPGFQRGVDCNVQTLQHGLSPEHARLAHVRDSGIQPLSLIPRLWL